MAFRKTLPRRFLDIAKLSSPDPQIRPRPSPSSLLRRLLLDSADHSSGLLRRLVLQSRSIVRPALPPNRLALPAGDRFIERMRGLNPDRIRPDGLAPPAPPVTVAQTEEGKGKVEPERRISVEEARKVLRASQMEAARARLRAVLKSCVPYSEFVEICCDAAGGTRGLEIARSLDDAGAVIVLGNAVFLRPELVAKAIESVIPLSLTHQSDHRRDELREMEQKKVEIDQKAVAQVRRELWCGLGFLVVQTVGLLRLTFWELSWNVMEPICFYLTSIYFVAGYAFFLRTSKDPSFEGFFESRFATKQRRLMKAHNFDIDHFNELKRACPLPSPPSEKFAPS